MKETEREKMQAKEAKKKRRKERRRNIFTSDYLQLACF